MTYWESKIKKEHKKNKITKNEKADVCIIGAGLTGLTVGYYLSKKNIKVTILEANTICSGSSGATTGKITSQHGLFYNYLINNYGVEFAKMYLQANENAISEIEKIIKDNNIDCDFVRQSSYVFCDKESEITQFEEEIQALKRLDFNAIYKDKIDIPISNFGGIEFPNQAMFDPIKYAYGLSNVIEKNNGKIYEESEAIDIKHENGIYKVYTKDNYVESKYVVIATHFPIKNFPGIYFMKMYQDISYVIAVASGQKVFDGYYINNSSPAISFRNANDDEEYITLISGSGHKVGRKLNLGEDYKALENIANNLFGGKYRLIDKWSTQDCVSVDKLPYIGQFSKIMENIYVATGFKKWGMTLSNVAANIITDKILGKENEYEELFKTNRIKLVKNIKSYKEQIKETVYGLGINKLKNPNGTIKDIAKDEGKIITYRGKKVGVYKDENGKCHFIKPICTHLGCELQFNKTDKTWDCPCHGSRFTIDGEVINNPAVDKIEEAWIE